MATVGGDPRVFGVEGSVDAGGDGFLSVVEMAETADGTGFVFVVAGDFHAAHGVHELEVGDEIVLGHFDGVVGLGVQVVGLFGWAIAWCWVVGVGVDEKITSLEKIKNTIGIKLLEIMPAART